MGEKPNRTLVLCSRGVTSFQKQVLKDLIRLLPHSKKESKIDRKSHYSALHDLAQMHSCNNILYLECRRKISYLWLAHYPTGPSVKFLVQNLHDSSELRLTGNCLKASRPILSFDDSFKKEAHLALIQQMFMQTFATPKDHPKAMPFIDHVFSFSQVFGQIYFRNFEVTCMGKKEPSLVEIGPRFCLTVVKVLDGVVCGETLYKNGNFIPPRRQLAEREVKQTRKKAKKREGDEVIGDELYGD